MSLDCLRRARNKQIGFKTKQRAGLLIRQIGLGRNKQRVTITITAASQLPLRRPAATSGSSDTHKMKHIVKILSLLAMMLAICVGLLQASIFPQDYTWLLPVYSIVSLGCYGLLMVGVGVMQFPTCPHESVLLQKDIVEAKEFLKQRGVDVVSD